jgi:signal transduction histidine kinase
MNNQNIPSTTSATEQELAHVTSEMYKKNKELAEKNAALALLRKIDSIILSKVTDIQKIGQEVADTITQELSFKLVAILLLDKDNKYVQKLAVSNTKEIDRAEKHIKRKLFDERISTDEEINIIAQCVKSRFMKVTHGLNNTLIPHFTDEESRTTQDIIDINASFVYPVIVREKVIGAMVLSINDKEGFSGFKNELIDRLSGVIGVAIDNALLYKEIQEANARLKEIDRLKDEFVSLASHELRTPMTVIKSYLWMMMDQKNAPSLSEKQQMYLNRAYVSTQRLINLVNDMLNVSRIESGRFSLNMNAVNIVELIDSVYAGMLPQVQQKSINFNFIKPDTKIPDILADKERVEQVLINLIGNSLKFTPQNGNIEISIVNNPEVSVITVCVADTGRGIAKKDMPRLFKQFSMVEGDYLTKQNSQGTGLGLYLSKLIIELMHGKIWAESEGVNKGAKFSFTLLKA